MENKIKRERTSRHEKYTLKLEPSTKLEYMHDKFTASLKLDVPVNFLKQENILILRKLM